MSLELFVREFEQSYNDLLEAYNIGNINKTLCMLRYITNGYYQTNYKLYDEDIERITVGVAKKILGRTRIDKSEDTICFYDGFGLLERGLAKIYIEALRKTGYKVVWILYDYLPDIDLIKEEYSTYENVEVIIIPKLTIVDRMKELRNVVKKNAPKHIFIYTKPDDVGGIGTLSTVRGDVSRYLIDLTDHAFWIGKCATDYVIAFRNLGCNIERKFRGFDNQQIIFLPYYPCERTEYVYQGMPFPDTCEFVFAGGAAYKIEGRNAFSNIVEYILTKYKKMKFVYACSTKNQQLERLEEKYPNRFFVIDERKDLEQIMKRAKFYLSTYPIGGGLMIQYAAQNRCIPVSLVDKETKVNNSDTVLLRPEILSSSRTSEKEVFDLIDQIMTDDDFYNKMVDATEGQVISSTEFEENIKLLLTKKRTKYIFQYEEVNMDAFFSIYRKRMNRAMFNKMVKDSRNQWVYERHPEIIN